MDFSEPSPGCIEVGVGSFEAVRMSVLLIMGFPRPWASFFFWSTYIFFLDQRHTALAMLIPLAVPLLSRASRELLVLGQSWEFELCSRMWPVYFIPGAKWDFTWRVKSRWVVGGRERQDWPKMICETLGNTGGSRALASMVLQCSELGSWRWPNPWKICLYYDGGNCCGIVLVTLLLLLERFSSSMFSNPPSISEAQVFSMNCFSW